MDSSDRYHIAAQELMIDFLDENGLLTPEVTKMIIERDAANLAVWASTIHNEKVKIPLDIFIGGMQVAENLKKLRGMVDDLTHRAQSLQQQLEGKEETDELDWSKVEGWH